MIIRKQREEYEQEKKITQQKRKITGEIWIYACVSRNNLFNL